MFGREVIYKNINKKKLSHCYIVEFMSGNKQKMFSNGMRNDDQFKQSLDVIWGIDYIKKITYLGLR